MADSGWPFTTPGCSRSAIFSTSDLGRGMPSFSPAASMIFIGSLLRLGSSRHVQKPSREEPAEICDEQAQDADGQRDAAQELLSLPAARENDRDGSENGITSEAPQLVSAADALIELAQSERKGEAGQQSGDENAAHEQCSLRPHRLRIDIRRIDDAKADRLGLRLHALPDAGCFSTVEQLLVAPPHDLVIACQLRHLRAN